MKTVRAIKNDGNWGCWVFFVDVMVSTDGGLCSVVKEVNVEMLDGG